MNAIKDILSGYTSYADKYGNNLVIASGYILQTSRRRPKEMSKFEFTARVEYELIKSLSQNPKPFNSYEYTLFRASRLYMSFSPDFIKTPIKDKFAFTQLFAQYDCSDKDTDLKYYIYMKTAENSAPGKNKAFYDNSRNIPKHINKLNGFGIIADGDTDSLTAKRITADIESMLEHRDEFKQIVTFIRKVQKLIPKPSKITLKELEEKDGQEIFYNTGSRIPIINEKLMKKSIESISPDALQSTCKPIIKNIDTPGLIYRPKIINIGSSESSPQSSSPCKKSLPRK